MSIFRPELTEGIIAAFYEVYRRLKFGYAESIYSAALEVELRRRGLRVERGMSVDVWYRDQVIGRQRIDLLVNESVIVEVKAGRLPDPNADQQVLSYLRATDLEVGLLLHFGPRPLFRRFVSTNDRKGGAIAGDDQERDGTSGARPF